MSVYPYIEQSLINTTGVRYLIKARGPKKERTVSRQSEGRGLSFSCISWVVKKSTLPSHIDNI